MGVPSCMASTPARTASITSVRMGEGGAEPGSPSIDTRTPSPTTSPSVAPTSAGSIPGQIRQFTVATADWGRAFSACPARSMVATQVVRVTPTSSGSFQSTSWAHSSEGSAANRRMASDTSPSSSSALLSK